MATPALTSVSDLLRNVVWNAARNDGALPSSWFVMLIVLPLAAAL